MKTIIVQVEVSKEILFNSIFNLDENKFEQYIEKELSRNISEELIKSKGITITTRESVTSFIPTTIVRAKFYSMNEKSLDHIKNKIKQLESLIISDKENQKEKLELLKEIDYSYFKKDEFDETSLTEISSDLILTPILSNFNKLNNRIKNE
jgi:hypothetical protein